MLMKLNEKGQSIAEYALVLTLVTGLVIGVQAYIKANLQHKILTTVNAVGDGGAVFTGTGETALLGNPTQDAYAKDINEMVATTYSDTQRKSKSMVEKELSPGGDNVTEIYEASAAKGQRKYYFGAGE